MLVSNSRPLDELLKSNASFKMNFEKLLSAFEKRLWTKDVCFLFKSLCEDLFNSYKIPVRITIKTNIDGDGRFSIDFLERALSDEEIAVMKRLEKDQEEWDSLPFWKKWFSSRPI